MSEPTATPVPAARPADEPHPLRAVVLAGGLTFEREVSLSSGTQVVEELTRHGLEAELDLHSTFDKVDTGTFRAVGRGEPAVPDVEPFVGPATSDRFEDGRA